MTTTPMGVVRQFLGVSYLFFAVFSRQHGQGNMRMIGIVRNRRNRGISSVPASFRHREHGPSLEGTLA